MSWPKNFGNKFGNKRIKIEKNGVLYSFPSLLENSVHDQLLLREKSGELRIEKLQDKVLLTLAQLVYIVDFKVYFVKLQAYGWVEAKGKETARWKDGRKLWKYYGPGVLEIYKGTHKRPYIAETLIPIGGEE